MNTVPRAFCDGVVAMLTSQKELPVASTTIPKWGRFFLQHKEQRRRFSFEIDEDSTAESIRQFVERFASVNVLHRRLEQVNISGNIPVPLPKLLELLGDLLKSFDSHHYFSKLRISLPAYETNAILNLLLERRAFFKEVALLNSCDATIPYLRGLEAYGKVTDLCLYNCPTEASEVLPNLFRQDQFKYFGGLTSSDHAMDSIGIDVFRKLLEKWLGEVRPQWSKSFFFRANFDLTPLEGVLNRSNKPLLFDALGKQHDNCDAVAMAVLRKDFFSFEIVSGTDGYYAPNRFLFSDQFRG